MSDTTDVELDLASSSSFCSRCVSRPRSSADLPPIAGHVTQLTDLARRHEAARSSPHSSSFANHVASRTSVLRPEHVLTCCRVDQHQLERSASSSTYHTGFQYTPVASIATTSPTRQPASAAARASDSRRGERPSLVLPTTAGTARRAHTRHHRVLCTSRPAHRSTSTSTTTSLRPAEQSGPGRSHQLKRVLHVLEAQSRTPAGSTVMV